MTDSTQEFVDGPLVTYMGRLDESPAFRRGQIVDLLSGLRERLQQMPDSIEDDHEVVLAAGDVVLVTHLLLRHQA